MARWPYLRAGSPAGARTRPDRLLRDNPVLLLSALQAPDIVAGLVAQWNPLWKAGTDGTDGTHGTHGTEATAGTEVAEAREVAPGVRWHGPIRLTPMLRADAGLPTAGPAASLGLAYVAEVRRSRAKVGDGRQAELLRACYPTGLPAGAEAEAWHLVRGLAQRLRGVARLPGGPIYAPHDDPRPLPGDTDRRVYGHDMLPWIVLREILRPLAPDLAREALPGQDGYILRHRGLLEVRVRGTDPAVRLPAALADRAGDGWPASVYEFCDLSAGSALPGPATVRRPAEPARAVRNAASLIAEVTGGVLLDADGFPVPIGAIAPR